jgi:hypothetical protein
VPSAHEHPFERALGRLLAAALVAAVLLQVSAGLAGLITGRGWASIPVGELLPGLARLSGHLDDPRQAFPARVERGLPAAAAWYGSLLGLLAAGATIALGVQRQVGGRRARDAARCARRRDLRPITSGRSAAASCSDVSAA